MIRQGIIAFVDPAIAIAVNVFHVPCSQLTPLAVLNRAENISVYITKIDRGIGKTILICGGFFIRLKLSVDMIPPYLSELLAFPIAAHQTLRIIVFSDDTFKVRHAGGGTQAQW